MVTGNLSEKEFRMMIVKMIQDLRKSIEAKIEKMQKMFNKDLKEMKSQSIMNNAITEIKSTLEGANSRTTEAEDRISEVEDRMVEINEAERKKKEFKEMRTISETSGTMLKAPTFES